MIAALEAIKTAVLVLAGLALGWIACTLYGDFVTLPAAREAGRQEERIVHEEQRRKAEAKARADREAAQAAIDRIERDYHERDAERAARMSALEAALEQEQSDAPASPAGGAACRVLIPGRVSNELDRIGRYPTRPHPTEPDAAVPGRR